MNGVRVLLVVMALVPSVLTACARREPPAAAAPDSLGSAIARDAPERLTLPAVPGRLVTERVAPVRASLAAAPVLAVEPPVAEPALPPATGEPAAGAASDAHVELKPPIARGLAPEVRGGRGGRVTLDVRVDESGEVSDVEVVESGADSLALARASEAALAQRYYPARMGTRPVAVWARQVVEVLPGR